jgi:hypothetical protein
VPAVKEDDEMLFTVPCEQALKPVEPIVQSSQRRILHKDKINEENSHLYLGVPSEEIFVAF